MLERTGSRLSVSVLVLGLVSVAGRADAQATYVGTFAMTNGASVKCATGGTQRLTVVRDPWAASLGQQWAFFRLPSGFYAIMNIETTEFLEPSRGFGAGPNIPLVLDPWRGDLEQ